MKGRDVSAGLDRRPRRHGVRRVSRQAEPHTTIHGRTPSYADHSPNVL